MKHQKILVTGASIAGPVLGYWLHQYGFGVTIVERAPELRLGGQNIDVKGPALKIVQQMGLEAQIRAANTTEVGLRFVNTRNKTLAEFAQGDALSMTQELEILRGDLVRLLYERTQDLVDYRFGDYITALTNGPDNVAVTFAGAGQETFDLVIIAEGIGSKTRQLVFGHEPKFRYLGVYTSYFTIPKAATDSRWARWCNAVRGIVFLLRPDNYGTTRASVNFRAPESDYERLPVAEQKKVLIEKIRGVGWEADRLIKDIEQTDDLYLARLSQVMAPHWSKGRVAMIGDTACCVTPIGGQGTDLAMAGAYILAGELHNNADYTAAFNAYEARLRPYVDKVQKLPPGVPNLVYPTSKPGVAVLNTLFALAGSKPAKWVVGLFSKRKGKPKEELDLPDYSSEA